MLKITILGIALAAIALAGTMSVADYKTIPLSLTQERNGVQTHDILCSDVHVPMKSPSGLPVCVFEESVLKLENRGFELVGELPSGAFLTFPPTSISGEPPLGPLPEVRISNLPNINETAVVTVTYTHDSPHNVTDTTPQAYPKAYSTGWRVSPGFEIVDDGGLTTKPVYSVVTGEIKYHEYFAPTQLNAEESITYTFEVRAIEEGTNYVAGVGYYEVDAFIHMYLDDEETMFYSEHRALYPELHQPPPKVSKSERGQAENAEHLRMLAEAIKNPPSSTARPLVGDELIEAVTMWVVKEDFTPEETVERLASHATLDVDDIRGILTGAGFSEDEINSALPTDDAPATKSSHNSFFFVSGVMSHQSITYGHDDSTRSRGVEVCAFDSSLSGIVNLGCDTTASNGFYFLQVPTDDPDNDDTTVDLYLLMESDGPHAEVRNEADYRYAKIPYVNINPDGTDQNVPIMLNSSDGGLHKAVQIIDAITDASDYLEDEGLISPKVTVNWELGEDPGDKTGNSAHTGSFYWRHDNEIYLDGTPDATERRWTMLHEYGHHVMNRIFTSYPDTVSCSGHDFHTITSVGCAWSEGWADFMPNMVDAEPVYHRTFNQRIDLEQGATLYHNGFIRNAFPTEQGMTPIGQAVEGRVAAALWDIKDNVNHTSDFIDFVSQDMLSEGDNEIVAIFSQGPQNFSDFDNMWNTNYGSKPTLSIMKLHGMDFAFETPTALPQDNIRVMSGTTTSIALRGEDPTIPNTNLSFILDSSPDRGNLFRGTNEITDGDTIPTSTPTAAVLDYAANYGTSGPDSFTFYVTDRRGASSTPATVSITITPVPGITFESYLESRTNIRLHFSMPISNLQAGDFTSSHGTIDGISPIRSSTDYNLRMSGVPAGAQVTITYVGESFNIPNNAGQLVSGTSSTSSKPGDTTPPTITAPPDRTVEATGPRTPVNIGTPDVMDDTDPNPEISNDAPPDFPVGTTIVTWTATDSSENTATATQRITVQDTTPPDITAPDDMSFTTTETSIVLTEAHYGTATADDLVDPSPTITSNAPTSFDAGRTTTITWTAEDRYHNSATDAQLITVILSSLNITAPPDVTVEATGSTMVIDIGTANATHDTDTDLTISNDAPESFLVGVTTTVTWKVVDSSGVTAMANQLVTVQDTTPPTFDEAPQDLSFVFDPDVPLIVNYDSPMATDIVDDSVGISCLPASGTAFGEGATTVTCTATDDYSNSADVTFDVNVRVYDTTVFFDGFEGRVHDSWDSPQFSFWSTDYNVPVTVPGHDSSNKIAHAAGCDFAGGCVMELTDGLDLSNHTDPEFLKFYRYLDTRLDPGDYLKLEAYDGSAWAELGRWNPENSEDDGAWHLEEYDLANYTDSSGFKLRFTAVAGAGIDEFGVDDVLVYKVPEVASNGTALAITAPADIVAEATGTLTAVDIGTATATGGFGNVTISHEPQAPFPLGNTTVTWTALDSNGTSATDTQLVTVQDTTAPTVASITRSDPAGGVTNSTSLIFAVTFSEDVTGVDVSDFALSPNSTGGGASATGQFAQTSEPALPIPDRSTIRDAITVGQSGNATSVSVAVDVTHTYIGDLKIDIIAPDGTTRTLHDRTGYETDDIDQTYAPDFAGVSIAGDWTLRVRDGAGGDTGTLNGWTLTIGHDGAGSPVTGLTGSGSVYYATVSAAQDGTYNLDLVPSGHGIADSADSPLADPNPTGADHTYTVDTAAPTVASIERSNPAVETTSTQTLVFAVTFSEDVTGVDVSDFALSPGSTGGGSAPGQFTQTSEPALRIADRGTIQDAITVDRSGTATSVSVAVDISHTYIGDLVVDLIAPDGTSQTLHSRTGGSANDIDRTYAPDFDGTGIAGDWTLRVSDRAGGDVGTLNGWTLTIGHGTTASPVTGLTGSGDAYLVTVSAAQDGTYNLDLASSGHGITDSAGNPLSSPTPTGADHTYTRTSP